MTNSNSKDERVEGHYKEGDRITIVNPAGVEIEAPLEAWELGVANAAYESGKRSQLTKEERTSLIALYGYEVGLYDGEEKTYESNLEVHKQSFQDGYHRGKMDALSGMFHTASDDDGPTFTVTQTMLQEMLSGEAVAIMEQGAETIYLTAAKQRPSGNRGLEDGVSITLPRIHHYINSHLTPDIMTACEEAIGEKPTESSEGRHATEGESPTINPTDRTPRGEQS